MITRTVTVTVGVPSRNELLHIVYERVLTQPCIAYNHYVEDTAWRANKVKLPALSERRVVNGRCVYTDAAAFYEYGWAKTLLAVRLGIGVDIAETMLNNTLIEISGTGVSLGRQISLSRPNSLERHAIACHVVWAFTKILDKQGVE